LKKNQFTEPKIEISQLSIKQADMETNLSPSRIRRNRLITSNPISPTKVPLKKAGFLKKMNSASSAYLDNINSSSKGKFNCRFANQS
jgi:hypothetical protein